MLVIIKVTSHPSSQCPHRAMGAQVMNLRKDTQWLVDGRLEYETTNSDSWAPAITPLSLLLLVDQRHGHVEFLYLAGLVKFPES